MYLHGDPIISGVENKVEDKPSSYNGPKCRYTVREKKDGVETAKQCNSPDVVWNVTGYRKYTRQERTDPVCGPHYDNNVWKEWDVKSAEKIGSAPKD